MAAMAHAMDTNGAYDAGNVLAKILDGVIPSHKVFESEHSLAILDAFPVCPGHVLVLPKLKGHATITTMPPAVLGAVMADVGRVADAVQRALRADGINLVQNNGKAAGQQVLHVHLHIIPRFADDKLGLAFPPNAKTMLAAADAKHLLDKLSPELSKLKR